MKILSIQAGSTSARQAATLCRNASDGSTSVTSATSSSALAAFRPPYPPPSTTTDGRLTSVFVTSVTSVKRLATLAPLAASEILATSTALAWFGDRESGTSHRSAGALRTRRPRAGARLQRAGQAVVRARHRPAADRA